MQDDAALERGEPQPGDEELARRRSARPSRPGTRPRPSRTISTASTSTLSATGSSSEPSGEVRPLAARDAAVEPVGRHRGDEDGGRPVVVTGKFHTKRSDHERHREGPRDGQLIGEAHRPGEYACDGRVLESAGRQPGRDRGPDLPHAARARHRLGSPSTREADRDSLHVAVADEAYLIGPGPAAQSYLVVERLLDAAAARGRRGRPSRATGSWPRTPPSRARSRRPGWSGSARRRRRSS